MAEEVSKHLPIAGEGFPFILIFLLLTIVALLAGFIWPAGLIFSITCFILFFFRDPKRNIPDDETAILSPADGKLIRIREIPAGEALEYPSIQLSVFMSVFNVHVNRIPFGGKILEKNYNPGKFHPAFREKASKLNEQTTMLIETGGGALRITQIAGLIARRIVCRARKGDILSKGERFGLIKFGSRVDIFLPQKNARIVAKLGDKVKAGETIIAYFHTLT